MKYFIVGAIASAFICFATNVSHAIDYTGMSPETYDKIQKNDQFYDNMTLEILKLKLKKDNERAQNPYIDCTLLGNVEGNNMEEAKKLARQMGANSIRWLRVTSISADGQAYLCPVK